MLVYAGLGIRNIPSLFNLTFSEQGNMREFVNQNNSGYSELTEILVAKAPQEKE